MWPAKNLQLRSKTVHLLAFTFCPGWASQLWACTGAQRGHGPRQSRWWRVSRLMSVQKGTCCEEWGARCSEGNPCPGGNADTLAKAVVIFWVVRAEPGGDVLSSRRKCTFPWGRHWFHDISLAPVIHIISSYMSRPFFKKKKVWFPFNILMFLLKFNLQKVRSWMSGRYRINMWILSFHTIHSLVTQKVRCYD